MKSTNYADVIVTYFGNIISADTCLASLGLEVTEDRVNLLGEAQQAWEAAECDEDWLSPVQYKYLDQIVEDVYIQLKSQAAFTLNPQPKSSIRQGISKMVDQYIAAQGLDEKSRGKVYWIIVGCVIEEANSHIQTEAQRVEFAGYVSGYIGARVASFLG